jgi:hypothetical protein
MSETHISAPLVLSEEEAAASLLMSKRSLQRLRLECEGPAYVQLTDSRVGYREPDLVAWVQTRIVDLAPLKASGDLPPRPDRGARPPLEPGPRAPPLL